MKNVISKKKDKNNTPSKKKIRLPVIEHKKYNDKNEKNLLSIKQRNSSLAIPNDALENILANNNNNDYSDNNSVQDEENKKEINKIDCIINDINNVNKNNDNNNNNHIFNNKSLQEAEDMSVIKNNNDNMEKDSLIIDNNNQIKKSNNNIIVNENNEECKKITKINISKVSGERLKKIKENRRIRLMKEQKEYELQSKLLNENKEKKSLSLREKMNSYSDINSPIKMNKTKAMNILEQGGMIDAYKYLISHLCRNGLPQGSLYEYSSLVIKNYERKWKKKQFMLLNDKIKKHFDERKKYLLNPNNQNIKNKIFFKVLEKREDEQFIKKLDKSRSTIKIIKRNDIINNISKNIIQEKLNNNISNLDQININNNINNNIYNINKFEGGTNVLKGKKNKSGEKVVFNLKMNNEEENDKYIKKNVHFKNRFEIESNSIEKNNDNNNKVKVNGKIKKILKKKKY